MENAYLEKLRSLLKEARPALAESGQLQFKNCFGAVGGYVGGRLFITCGKFGVALKLPKDVLDELFSDGDVKSLRYFPQGHTKKEYAVLPERILKSEGQFQLLLEESIRYVQA